MAHAYGEEAARAPDWTKTMNEMDRLKNALNDRAAATPRREAKDAAIAAALSAFDAKPVQPAKEKNVADRLIGAAHAAFETMMGRRKMRMTHALAGGASLLVLTLAVMTAANLQTFDTFSRPTIGVPPVKDLTEEARARRGQTAEPKARKPTQPAASQRRESDCAGSGAGAAANEASAAGSGTSPPAPPASAEPTCRRRPERLPCARASHGRWRRTNTGGKSEMDRLIASNNRDRGGGGRLGRSGAGADAGEPRAGRRRRSAGAGGLPRPGPR